MALSLSMLGPISASLENRPLHKFQTKRAQALLLFLATELALGTAAHRREALIELLWPGLPLKSARVSLRQTLYLLRQTVPDHPAFDDHAPIPFLLTDRSTAQINPDYPLESDVAEFLRLLEMPQDVWPEGVAHYRGDFLADFYLEDANTFEEWAAARRAAFRRQALEALDKLTAERIGQGDYDEAERFALRQLEIDRLRESAYRQLMRLYAWSGRGAEALSLYQECVQILDNELAAQPDEATTALYEAIRQNRLPPPEESPPEAPSRQAIPRSPFRGLYAFREEDAADFFGRESFTQRLLKAIVTQPLVALVGPSGSGKSSVLFAGLIAEMRRDRDWAIASFRPGGEPFQALASALLPLLEAEMSETDKLVETRKLASALDRGELPLTDVISRITQNHHRSRMLLLVDQFEELYTLCSKHETWERFVDLVLAAIGMPENGAEPLLTLVLALRADFLGQALGYRPLADALQGADVILGPMTRKELAQAVEKPAEKRGVQFESGLAERILEDVGDEPGNLPLLQFALTALWERQVRGTLSHSAYEEIGRVQGALAGYAEGVYERLRPGEQEEARRLFVQMIRPGERTEDTRRLALQSELGEESWALAQQLADARLVVTGRDPAGRETAELVHEALIQSWERLRFWLEEDRAFRAWQERLRAALHQWEESERDEGALLRGIPLSEAEGWLGERGDFLSAEETAYIKAGQELRDRESAERERRRMERERRRRRITLGIALGLVIALALAAFAGVQWRRAGIERDRAQSANSHQLAAVALSLVGERLDLASLLSVEAFRSADTFEARNALLATLTHNPHLRTFLHGHEGDVRAVAFSADGRLVATGGADGAIRLWDIALGEPLGRPITAHTGLIRSMVFNPDDHSLATSGVDDAIHIWDTEEIVAGGDPAGALLLTIEIDDVSGLAYSPDGNVLVAGAGDGNVLQWNTDEASESFGRPLGPPLAGLEGNVVSVAIAPDGRILAGGDTAGEIFMWEMAGGEPLGSPLAGHSGSISGVAFGPDGAVLASASLDGTVRLWDVTAQKQVGEPLKGHTDAVTGLAISAEGNTLASASKDGQIALWELSNALDGADSGDQMPVETLTGHQGSVWSVAFGPDGRTLASGGAGNAILWDTAEEQPLAELFRGSNGAVSSAAFSPDGKLLATAGADDSIILWDAVDGSATFGKPLSPPFVGHSRDVEDVAFSPDGQLLASGSADGTIRLWDVAVDRPIGEPLTGHTGSVVSVSFHPNGRILASASVDGTFVLWDVDRGSDSFGRAIVQRPGPPGSCSDVLFAPNGQSLAVGSDLGDIYLLDVSALLDTDFSKSPNRDDQSLLAREVLDGLGLQVLSGHTSAVLDLAFSPDGRVLTSAGGADRSIRLWDVDNGQLLGQPLTNDSQQVFTVDVSPDGRTLASASSNQPVMVVLWDVASGRKYSSPLVGHTLGAQSASFSPDGRKLVATSRDRGSEVLLWDVDVDSWIARACTRANRNLTMEEWRQYFGEEPYRETCPGKAAILPQT